VPLQVPAGSRFHSLSRVYTNICPDLWYPRGSCPDGSCEACGVGRCNIAPWRRNM